MVSTRSHAASGMTLVEVLVALVVLMIGTAGLIGINRAIMTSNSFARDLTTANALAASRLEELRVASPTIPVGAVDCRSLLMCGAVAATGADVDERGRSTGTSADRFRRCWCTDGITVLPDVILNVRVAFHEEGGAPTTCGGATHCVSMSMRRAP
jgi:type II secretory pathway pseudopilin PulG